MIMNRPDIKVIRRHYSPVALFLCMVLFCASIPAAQVPGNGCNARGYKYLKNFETRFHNQNWSVAQDRRGIIYIANNGGVLEFDGAEWRTIKIPNWKARSIAINDSGKIFIGGVNEIGCLEPDAENTLQYVSLVRHVDEKYRKFSTVWRINMTADRVFFRTSKYLFGWNGIEMKTWKANARFNGSFTCYGKLYVHQRGVGLGVMENGKPGKLKMLREKTTARAILSKVKLYMLTEFYDGKGNGKLLAGTRSNGFFILDRSNPDGMTLKKFPTEADNYLAANKLYHGIALKHSRGKFALATLLGGVVIIDSDGKLNEIMAKDYGLRDDNIKYVYEDRGGNLWLAADNGVSFIEYASPFTIFDDPRARVPHNIQTMTRHPIQSNEPGCLFIGSTRGLFYQSPSRGGRFQPVPRMSAGCFSLLSTSNASTSNALLAATNDGVFSLRAGTAPESFDIRRISAARGYILYGSPKNPARVYCGTRRGITVLARDNKNRQWAVEQDLNVSTLPVNSILENNDGSLWLGTSGKNLLKVDFPAKNPAAKPQVTVFGKEHGLTDGPVRIFLGARHPIFAPSKGIFSYHPAKNKFIPDNTLGEKFAGGRYSVFRLVEDSRGTIWFHSQFRNYRAVPGPGGVYRVEAEPFRRVPSSQVNVIYPEPGQNIAWFAGSDGLARFDAGVKKDCLPPYPVLIRRVTVNGDILYGGGYPASTAKKQTNAGLPQLPYAKRNFTFNFAIPYYEDPGSTMYSCLLEGYDTRWSEWDSGTSRVYTNLEAGSYRFRVRAVNVYEIQGAEASFSFRVLPPWYFTWWAFCLYAALFIFLLYFVSQWRSRKLEKEKQRLEEIVKDRTREIYQKNTRLEEQTVQLMEQSNQLKEMDRVKSRFFANISHEFRTPLTLIMGPLEQMLEDVPDNRLGENYSMMLRNSRRLLLLINQLLDLSRADGGKAVLCAAPYDIVPFVRDIVSRFRVLARQYSQEFYFNAPDENIPVYIDPGKMEIIIGNLLSNAVKFTPDNGTITVSVETVQNEPGSRIVHVSVADTGPGIPHDQLEDIFDRFYQAPRSLPGSRNIKGTGIGLSLAREFARMHRGGLDVSSCTGENSGSVFTLHLLLGSGHLQPGEITEPAPYTAGSFAGYLITTGDSATGPPNGEKKEEKEENAAQNNDIEDNRHQEQDDDQNIVLVVEDNPDVRLFICSALREHYRVEEAVDGAEGLEKAKKLVPDLIITDVMMPRMDGFELCARVKKEVVTSHIPIIMLTAKASEDSVVYGFDTGADEYIPKPFSTRIILARIRNLIDARRQLQEKIRKEYTILPQEQLSGHPPDEEPDPTVESVDDLFMKDLKKIISENLSNAELSVEILSEKLLMSHSTLYRKIQALTGETPKLFIRSCRLQRAARLLKANYGNITEVAFAVGFSSAAYFTRCFKDRFHMSPSDYQTAEEF